MMVTLAHPPRPAHDTQGEYLWRPDITGPELTNGRGVVVKQAWTNTNQLSPTSAMDHDFDIESNASSSDERPRKSSLVSRQLAKIRSSIRIRRSTASTSESCSAAESTESPSGSGKSRNGSGDDDTADYDEDFRPLMTYRPVFDPNPNFRQPQRHLAVTSPSRKFRSASTPTLCCCAANPNNRRSSQPATVMTSSQQGSQLTSQLRHHFQTLARIFKRTVVSRSKKVSTSLSPTKEAHNDKECAKHLRQLLAKVNPTEGSTKPSLKSTDLRPRLTVVLRDEKAYEAFRMFLKGEYSDENIEFWSDVEVYKQTVDEDKRREMAKNLVSTYLQTDATSEINISYETKAETLSAVENSLDENTFNRAQNEILFLMESDAFKRFLSTAMD